MAFAADTAIVPGSLGVFSTSGRYPSSSWVHGYNCHMFLQSIRSLQNEACFTRTCSSCQFVIRERYSSSFLSQKMRNAKSIFCGIL
jgi:hypothetical protein